jgi:hypothetical protein
LSATSAVPAPHLEGKNEKDISEVTAYFKLQNQPNACYPTCICNVLKALANMHQYPPIAFPEHQVNKLCGYRMDFGPNMSIVVPNMDKALRSHGYGAYTKIPTTYDALVKIVEDKESSYPVIEVSYKYLEDRTDLAEDEVGIGSPPDHMIIVLSCNPDQTIIFDPYDAHSKVMQTRPDRVGRGLYVISTGQLTEYWEKAFYGSWTFWVRRKTKETTKSTFLDQYSSTREVK